ncbi:MAG: helix-turn-helix domain-containing protein [Pseudonocardia sp.]
MPPTVRTSRKLLLGREIAHMLANSGVTQVDAAKLIETSPARIASLINGGSSIGVGDLELLARKLGFTDEGYLDALRELRRDNHKRGYWTTGHNRAYAEDLRLLVDLEKDAERIRGVRVEVVPGLLQCEAYVRAQHVDVPSETPLEDRIKARMVRQEILTKAHPPAVEFVLSESCLRRVSAPAAVMREQMEYLITLSRRRNVFIQVMPFDHRAAIDSPFTLIRVPSPGAAGPLEVAYVEGMGEIRYLDDKKALAAHEAAWTRLSNAALRFEETRKFLARVAKDFQT